MKRKAMLAVLAMLTIAGTASAGDWYSEGKWGSVNADGYTIRNNIWGNGAGFQCIWASWGSGWRYWGVWADHPNTSGVKAYPHISKWVGKNINNIPWIGCWFKCERPSKGSYCTSYDIWLNNHSYEIMLWMNKQGNVGPIGSYKTSASLGGHSWKIYSGWNGYNTVYSFVRTSNTNSGSVDIKAILNWLQQKRWLNNPYLEDVQMGFEISSCSGGAVFEMYGFSEWNG